MESMLEEFDGVREIVYVADMENYDLLFINKAGLNALGYENREQVAGKKCYELLQGFQSPCSYCKNEELCREEFLEWVHHNSVTNKNYRIKDKLIPWDGRLVRMEIAEDITEYSMHKMETEIKNRLESERIVMDCIKMMYSSVETDIAINNTLEILGKYLGGERTYIFHVHGKSMDNTYEWCAEGVSREIDSLQNVPITIIERWIPFFNENECVIIEDVEKIKEESPAEYETLKPQNIQSLITVPIIEKGKLAGYFGIDNPRMGNLNEISNILKMLAYFFQFLLERKKRDDYLKKLGYTDGMTGALNRNAFIRDTMPDDNRELVSAGCFFIDINGLKRMNDTHGHEAGDELIRQVYRIVCSEVKDYPVYRLGGDEFVVLCQNISREDMAVMEQKLRKRLDGEQGCSAAVGAGYLENPNDLGVIIDEADQRMYQAKELYYNRQKTN
ncbi:MAG: diguanylate cyclase [Bacteroides sp.]|nr:diguanylate cyclase [Bacteroides sp.]MCM1550473.1 diguanylate cyclase [Clostridium sp.]